MEKFSIAERLEALFFASQENSNHRSLWIQGLELLQNIYHIRRGNGELSTENIERIADPEVRERYYSFVLSCFRDIDDVYHWYQKHMVAPADEKQMVVNEHVKTILGRLMPQLNWPKDWYQQGLNAKAVYLLKVKAQDSTTLVCVYEKLPSGMTREEFFEHLYKDPLLRMIRIFAENEMSDHPYKDLVDYWKLVVGDTTATGMTIHWLRAPDRDPFIKRIFDEVAMTDEQKRQYAEVETRFNRYCEGWIRA